MTSFSIANKKGRSIECTETNPRKPAIGTIIITHGLGGGKNTKDKALMSRALASNGFRVVRYNTTAGSYKARHVGSVIEQKKEDLKAVIDHYHEKGESRFGVLGNSMGGTAATFLAAEDERISALVLLACPVLPRFAHHPNNQALFNAIKQLERQQTGRKKPAGKRVKIGKWNPVIHGDFFRELEKLDSLDAVRKITCPTLFVHGENDSFPPREHTEAAYQEAKAEKDYLVVVSEGHNYTDRATVEKVKYAAVNWFLRHVPSGRKAP